MGIELDNWMIFDPLAMKTMVASDIPRPAHIKWLLIDWFSSGVYVENLKVGWSGRHTYNMSKI